jgi:hypothetical protein
VNFDLTIEEELNMLDKYKLTPTELFVVKLLLIAQIEGEEDYIYRYVQIPNKSSFREVLESLQSKGVILKSYKIPKSGEKLIIEDIDFNKNFVKNIHRASFELGKELYENYPQTTYVKGQVFNLRRVSKKFNSLEDAFFKYGKYIRFDNELHNEVIELVKWGIQNGYNFTTMDSFIIDQDWRNIKNVRDGGNINVNYDAVKLL